MEESPARLEETPVIFSGFAGTMSPCANSWMTSLAWLEKSVPDSPVLETLHQSLPVLFRDKGTAITPVSMATAATWKTPPSLMEAGVNTSPGEVTSTEDNTTETDSLLGHRSHNQLGGLSRPVLEGCLESAFVMIEAFAHHLRACQELQRPVPHMEAAQQRTAMTQTPGECSDKSEMLRRVQQSVRQSHEVQSLAKRMAGTLEEMTGLSEGYAEYTKDGSRFAGAVQEDWRQMQLDYEAWRSMLAKCQGAMMRMKEEVKASRRERAQHQEICEKLKRTAVSLRHETDQVTQLAKTKACLEADLRATLQKAASAMKNEQKLLLQENELFSQQLVAKEQLLREMEGQMMQMSQEKETAEREWKTSRRELRELLDCREFMEQENRVCRSHVREVEEELKASRLALWERNAQLEDLKDARRVLGQEQEALRRELAACRADLQRAQGSVERFCQAVLEIQTVQARFSGLVASLQEEAADSTQGSGMCALAHQEPHSLGSSFVDSILRAVAERDQETPGIGSEASAFTKTSAVTLPTPEEVEQRLAASIRELQEVADQIGQLTSQQRKAAQEEVQSLQVEILQLECQRKTLEAQLEADEESHAATVAELSKTLNLHRQHLQEELSQLKQDLRKAETEAAVLWEELRGARAPDVGWVQEKVQLSQEVGKLRELLLEKSSENSELLFLKEQLYQAKQRLKRSKQVAEVMREAFTRLDTDVADVSELRHLLDLLE
ncbi:sperm-associated antigen 5 isoform X2 [Paroedura picta]|uniref:sperm-associated antigen 5 isoform X2 n=1 Tax=Paroedura picta TaxID=143630 RepID=UPI0040579BCE